MTRFVALLRGVNVGGNTVKSAPLAAMARDIGLEDVRTVLASGNLVFTADERAPALKRRIEKALGDTFGYDAWIVLATADHVAAVIDDYPFDEREGYHPYVVFGSEQAVLDEIVEAAAGLPDGDEKVAPGDGVVYWECPRGSTLHMPFSKLIGKAKYRSTTTTRNLRTLRKVL